MTEFYACNPSLPKSRRWFATRKDATGQLLPTSNLEKKESLAMERLWQQGGMENVPHGFGSWSFWRKI